MRDRLRVIPIAMAVAVVAAIGAVPGAFDTDEGVHHTRWAIDGALGLIVALGLLVRPDHRERQPGSGCLAVSALLVAGLLPLATESSGGEPAKALAVMVIAAGIATVGRVAPRHERYLLTGAALIASGLDASALLWPLSILLAAWAEKRGRRLGVLLMTAGIAGAVIGWKLRGAPAPELPYGNFGYAVGRDLLRVIPVVMLGLAGCLSMRHRARGATHEGPRSGWGLWATMSGIGLLAGMVGLPFNVRLGLLPLALMVPRGLSDLAILIRRQPQSTPLLRLCAYPAAILLAGFAWHSSQAWMDGVLMLFYLIVDG